MPITVTPIQPGNLVGPGLQVGWSSDFIGPLPTGTTITLDLTTDSEGATSIGGVTIPTNLNHGTWLVFETPRPSANEEFGSLAYPDNQPIFVQASLAAPGDLIDTGTQSATWTTSAGLAEQLRLIRLNQGVGAGLTTTQSTQLSQIATRTQNVLGDTAPTITDTAGAHTTTLAEIFSGKTLDTLTLDEVTSGPQSTPAAATVVGWYFGVIVRITSLPPNAVPLTPDEDWYPQCLAVLRVFRGTDLETRIGLHNTSLFHPFRGLYASPLLNESLLFPVPPATSVEVDFAFGVEGQVFLLQLP